MTIAKINETAGHDEITEIARHGELDNISEHLQRKTRLPEVAK
jgi:hypothetical protein